MANENQLEFIIKAIVEGQEEVAKLAKEVERLTKATSEANKGSIKESKEKAAAEKSSAAEIVTASTSVLNTVVNVVKQIAVEREAAAEATRKQAEAETLLGQVTGLLTEGTREQASANQDQGTSIFQLIAVSKLLFAGYESYTLETGALNRSMKILTQNFDENATTADKANKIITDFKDLFKDLTGSTSGASTAFEKFKELLGPVGKGITAVASAVGISEVALVAIAGALLAAVAAIAAVVAVSSKAAAAFAKLTAETNELSKSTGINTETTLAASKSFEAAGLSAEDYRESLNGLLDKVAEAKNGNDELKETLEKEFGITAFDNASLAVEQFNNTIQGISLESEKGRKAIEVFGRDTAGFFKVGGAEIGNFRKQFKDAGLVIDQNSILISEKLTSGFKRATLAIDTLFASLGKDLVNNIAPGVTELTAQFEKLLVSLAKSKDLKAFFRSIAEEVGGLTNAVVEVTKAFDDSAISFTEALSPLILLNRVVGDLTENFSGARKGLVEFFLPFKEIIDLFNEGKKAYEEQIRIQRELEEANAKIARSNFGVAASVSATISAFDDTKKAIRELVNIDTKASEDLIKNAENRLAEVAVKLRKGTIQEEQAKEERIKIVSELVQQELALLKDKASEQATIEKNSAERSIESIKNAYSQGAISAEQQANEINRINEESVNGQIKRQVDLFNTLRKFKEEGFDVSKQLTEAEIALDSLRTEQAKQNSESRANLESGILQAKQDQIDKINRLEIEATEKLQQELNARKINQEQFDAQVLENKIRFDKQRLEAEQGTLIKLNDLEGASVEVKTAVRQEVADRRLAIAANEADREIQISERVITARLNEIEKEQTLRSAALERRKAEIAQIKDLDLQRIQQGRLEIDILLESVKVAQDRVEQEELQLKSLRDKKANNEEIALQEARIAKAVADVTAARAKANAADKASINEKNAQLQKSLELQQQEIDKVTSLADKNNSLTGILEKQAGKVQSVNKTFDATTATIEQTIKRIADLRADANQILLNGQSATQGRIEAAFTFFDTASDLERKLGERILKESVEAQRKANEERARITAEADAGIKEKIQEGLEEQADDRREYNKTIKELNKDLEENAQGTADEIVDIQNDTDAKIQKIFSDAREKEAKERATEIDRIKAERRQLEIDLRKIDEDARKDKAKREADAIVDRAALNKAVRDAQELVDKGGTEEERAAAKKALEEAQAKLAEFDKKNKGREAAEAEKNKKIKEAEQLLAKEKGEATTEEEIKAAEARFKARKEAAEKGLQDELDFQDQLAELQETGTKEEIDALKAKYTEIKKLNDEADVARLKDIDEQLALEKALRAKAEAERQAEIEKQVEEEKKRSQEAIDRLREQGAKREEEIRKQIDKESKQFEKAEAERNAKIAQAIAEVSAGLQLASSQLSDYVTNLAKSLGLAADKIKPIADAIAQINNATKTSNSSSSSTSNPTSNPSNPGSTGNNPFSSPTQGDNNGSAGNLGFNRQAANQGNQNNQQGQQNNNNPSSPPASPSNNQPSQPSSNQANPSTSSNAPISASSNQANQNSESNNNIASAGSPSDDDQFRSEMSKIFDSLLNAAKQTKKPKDLQNLKNKTLESTDQTKGKYVTNRIDNFLSKYEKLKPRENPRLFNFGETNYQNALLKSSQKRFDGIQKLNKEKFMNGVEITITALNRRFAEIVSQIKLLGLEQGLKDTVEADTDSSPTDVDTGSNPSQPGGGRGNNPGPRSPGSTNPVKPSIPNSGGLTDKEKAVFAGRDKDANTGFDEAEASGLAGRRGLRPDAAVGGGNAGNSNEAQDPSLTSNSNSPGPGASQPQNQTINQTNNSPVTVNLNVQGFLGDRKTLEQLEQLFGSTMKQKQDQDQQKLRNLMGSALLR